jgi:hypothetical protein
VRALTKGLQAHPRQRSPAALLLRHRLETARIPDDRRNCEDGAHRKVLNRPQF